MLPSLLPLLICPVCKETEKGETLILHSFSEFFNGHIVTGILKCTVCNHWFPIEKELLELTPLSLAYNEDKSNFFQKFKEQFELLNISKVDNWDPKGEFGGQIKQREHYDNFEKAGKIAYDDFENLPFWISSDQLTYNRWKKLQQPEKSLMLDIGCGNGRSVFRLINPQNNIVGMDISKKMLQKAIERTKNTPIHESTSFMVGDATSLPFRNGTFNYSMTSGVMSNLPDVRETCAEIFRVLKPRGIYFGLENNKSVFRGVFDFLSRIIGIWKNVKGASPEISHSMLKDWFPANKVKITSVTSVFLPPNIFNIPGKKFALKLLEFTNRIFYFFGLRNQGGLIIFEVQKLER